MTFDPSKIYTQSFERFGDFLKTAMSTIDIVGKPIPDSNRSSRETSRTDFYQSKSFQEAVDKLYEKNPKFDRIRKISHEIDTILKTVKPNVEQLYDVTGSYVDVSRFLEREPENMVEFEIDDTQSKLIHVVVNLTTVWMAGEEEFFNRGAGILSLVNALEDLGFKTRIDVYTCVAPYGRVHPQYRWVESLILVKDYNFILDEDLVTSVLCEAWFFRRLVFSIWENLPEDIRISFGFVLNGGYGIVERVVDYKNCDIYIPPIFPGFKHFQNLESSVKYVKEKLKEVFIRRDILKKYEDMGL
jgi:hypothetical protein